jgi:hypothetical protein
LKTVTVITDTGERWNVAPRFLRRAEASNEAEGRETNVIPLPKK